MTVLVEPPTRAKVGMFTPHMGSYLRVQLWGCTSRGHPTDNGRVHQGYLEQARGRNIRVEGADIWLSDVCRAWVLPLPGHDSP